MSEVGSAIHSNQVSGVCRIRTAPTAVKTIVRLSKPIMCTDYRVQTLLNAKVFTTNKSVEIVILIDICLLVFLSL